MSIKSLFGFGEKVEESQKSVNLTGDAARACLATKEFKTYRAQYAILEEKVIEELIKEASNFCVSGDSTEKFGAKCLVKLTRLRDLRSLMTKVLVDAEKGKENVDKQNND
jgi:hypothetical protein